MNKLSVRGRQQPPGAAQAIVCLLVLASALGAWPAEPDVRRDAAVAAIERVMPAVVNIQTKTMVERRGFYEDLLREFYGPYYRRRPADMQYSLGSGVIIDEAGYVLTNLHVVERANEILVKLANGEVYQAEPVGAKNQTDVALLRLRAKKGQKFIAAPLAPDDDLLLGETVLALGSPFGLGGTVTRGILSSKSRRPPAENEPMDVGDWLQTDAAINPGNSGGPLINLRAEVIGINVAVYREGQGIGFAIPIKRVSQAIAEILTPEETDGLWFGARVKPGRLPLEVSSVQAGSPAATAGLRGGDRIISVNGKVPKSVVDFNRELTESGDRQPVALLIQHGAERRALNLRLIKETAVFNANLVQQRLGARVQALTEELARVLGLNTLEGLVITGVDQSGPAAEAGLKRRVVVQAIDGTPTREVVTAAKLLYAKKSGEATVLTIVVERSLGPYIEKNSGNLEVKVR